MKFATHLFLTVLAGISSACVTAADRTAEPIEVSDVCKKESSGKFVTLKGYLSLPTTVSCRGQECVIALTSKPYGGAKVALGMKIGDAAGQMDRLPDRYSWSDLKVHTTTGTAGENDLVEVTGKIWYSDFLGTQCRVDINSASTISGKGPSADPAASP